MSGTILIIEDEPSIADTIVYALKTEGFTTEWVSTGAEALAFLQKFPVNLVILDVGLPDRNGFDLCRDIRRTSGVPIIFLTARAGEVDRVVGLEIGADDYVVKPFSPRELAARAKAILRRAVAEHPSSTPHIVQSPFQVDRPRMIISYFGKPLDLTRYEYRLLDALISRPDWVFTRDALMEKVWEDPGSSTDRTVDAHIKTLRAKLRQVRADNDPIQTHRGTGYSLHLPS